MFCSVNESNIGCRQRFIWSKGFFGGVAMAAPFYAEFFSWRWTVLLVAPLLFFSLFFRGKINRPPLAILPMVLLLLLHVTALVFSSTPFAEQVIKDLVIASFLLFVYVLADEDMLAGFFSVLIPLALITALLGLLKAGLLDRGYLIGFIKDSCSYYPAGSALCVNYNNLGLLWLVGALGCVRSRFWWCLPFVLAAGALSGSRRFILLMSLIPVIWILIYGRDSVVKLTAVLSALAVLIIFIPDPLSFEEYRFGKSPYKVLEWGFGQEDEATEAAGQEAVVSKAVGQEAVVTSINRSAPMAMLGTMADGTFGTASRLDLWRLGASLVGWAPQGWSYHQVFACEFSACTDYNYPHMSLISEWIIGGVLFAVVGVAFFIWPLWHIMIAWRLLPIALFLLAMPYVLVSGDTVFSLSICISCMLVALSSVKRYTHSFSVSPASKSL